MTTRRRFLTILAGAGVLPILGQSAQSAIPEWRGIALGAEARLILDHPQADRILKLAVSEIHRLEGLFSLYRADSELSRLNRNGVLVSPSPDMLALLSICGRMHARTAGAFDPTIQSLWSLYAQHASRGTMPDAGALDAALAQTGWDKLVVRPDKITATSDGLGLSLNGVAQGFIADKVTQLLRNEGMSNALVNTGEIAALGQSPNGQPWQVTLPGPKGRMVDLKNKAIASSSALGTTFDQRGTVGHILDPRTGRPSARGGTVTVIAETAAEADALSTAACLMSETDINAAKRDCVILFG